MWSDERDLIMKLLEESNEVFPRKCPCCEEKSGHVFMYRHSEEDLYGSAWAWCSKCKEFSHSRYIIPDWWKNYEKIDESELHSYPDNLDLKKDAIDEWINALRV